MNIGRLKYKVEILAKTEIKSDTGAITKAYQVLYILPADIVYKSGTKEADNKVFNNQVLDVIIRFKKDIDESILLRYGGRIYKVNFISPVAFRGAQTLSVERITDPTIVIVQRINFVSSGLSFSPLINISGEATILWEFADGTTSNQANPAKNYGSAANRNNYLTVTPWSALTGINLGYDAFDSGSDEIPLLASQNVLSVTGLNYVASSLSLFCASNNPIGALDFRNFTALHTVELYNTPNVNVTLGNNVALRRLCLEAASSMTSVDISGCTGLADLRASQMNLSAGAGVIMANAQYLNLWHFCVRDYPAYNHALVNLNLLPALREFWTWNSNQSGTLDMRANTELLSAYVADNHYTAANFDGCFPAGRNGEIRINGNDLTSLIVTNCPGLGLLEAQNNNLASDVVDSILATINGYNTSNGTLDLRGNGSPTTSTHINALVARGWTVQTESVGVPTVSTPTFTPAAGEVASGSTVAIACATSGATIHYTTDGSAPSTSSPVYSTPITINANTTIRAIAVRSGYNDSAVAQAAYTIAALPTVSTPTFTPAAGEVASGSTVAIACATSGATIRYTTDGSAPSTSSPVYSTPITINANTTIRAIAVRSGYNDSAVAQAAYTIAAAAARLDFTSSADSVTISLVVVDTPTITWHWGDGTTSTGANPGTRNFGTAESRNHYVLISDPEALTRININGASSNVTGVSGLNNFANMLIIMAYQNRDLTTIGSIDQCSNMNELHLAETSISTPNCDQIFIDLDNSGAPGGGDTVIYLEADKVTATSAGARTSLLSKGWVINFL